MNKELIGLLKKEMQYNTEEKKCSNCKFTREEENPHLDRSWDQKCFKFDPIVFEVSTTAICKYYEKLKK